MLRERVLVQTGRMRADGRRGSASDDRLEEKFHGGAPASSVRPSAETWSGTAINASSGKMWDNSRPSGRHRGVIPSPVEIDNLLPVPRNGVCTLQCIPTRWTGLRIHFDGLSLSRTFAGRGPETDVLSSRSALVT